MIRLEVLLHIWYPQARMATHMTIFVAGETITCSRKPSGGFFLDVPKKAEKLRTVVVRCSHEPLENRLLAQEGAVLPPGLESTRSSGRDGTHGAFNLNKRAL